MLRALVLLASVALPRAALATTWYVSPAGIDDPGSGSQAQPFKTLAYGALRAVPSDTFVLRDGTYDRLEVSCQAGASHGTPLRPIVVRAETERRVRVHGDGLTPTLRVLGCSWWTFEGLELASADAVSPGQEFSGALLSSTTGVVLRRMVFSHTNRDVADDALLWLQAANDTLLEDSELYAFHGAAVRVEGARATLRRVYFHGRSYGDGGSPTTAVALSPCDGCLLENVVSERAGHLVLLSGGAATASQHNRITASVSLDDEVSVLLTANAGAVTPPADTLVSDLVALRPTFAAVHSLGGEGTRVERCTSLEGKNGYIADVFPGADAGAPSFVARDSLAAFAQFAGFAYFDQADAGLENDDAWGNAYDYIPPLGPSPGSLRTEDPRLGACRLFVPPASPLKDAGIGATVLYRSVDGGITAEPLWEPSTGAFPCGAVVPGVSDVSGSSCFDLHQRLGVNSEACPLPFSMPLPDAGVDGGQPVRSGYALQCTAAGGDGWAWLGALFWLTTISARRRLGQQSRRRESAR